MGSQSLRGIVRNQERVSPAYETSVSKKRLHTKRKTLHFVVGNERFPFVVRNEQRFKNLHGVVGNKECFIAYLQSEILIFLAFVSLGDLTFFFFRVT